MTILFLSILIMRFRRWKVERQLRWQQSLATNGIGMKTELLEVKQEKNLLKGHIRFCLLVRLRVKGRIVCRHVYTLLKEGGALRTGEKVHIRYNPSRINLVLLCNEINN